MEAVLDVYSETYDEQHRLICMDEAAKQVTSDLEEGLPMMPGQARCEDHHYQREGVQALFAFFDPLRGWRRVTSRDQRARGDWAEEVRHLLEIDCPDARLVTLVCDNLNTHDVASLYARFDAATAHRLARRLRLVHTPRNGSWLNMAEIELSILTRQCLNRRFASVEEMRKSIAAWEKLRNNAGSGANWRFTTADARIKLKSLYPHPEDLA